MFKQIEWEKRQLLKSTDADNDTDRVAAVEDFIDNYNNLVQLLDAFVRTARKMPNY